VFPTKVISSAIALVALLGGPGSAWGYLVPSVRADSLPALRLPEGAEEEIRLDGVLDEAAWERARPISDFRQREPMVGEDGTERTEVRAIFGETTLFIGIRAFEEHPDQIVSRILQRDRVMEAGMGDQGPQFTSDDAVAILFDPFQDRRNGIVFATNPNGAEFDALLTDEGREFNVDWRGVWEVRSARTEDGWSAEFAIPFRTIRYPANGGDGVWGFNVYRIIRHKNEQVLWRSWSRDNEGFQRVSKAGALTGMEDLPQGSANWEAKPYVLGGVSSELNDEGELPTTGEGKIGLDLKGELRPGLVLDLTLNTDFAQVEVDDEQVNLTRFDLFFPEKRDFFLENAGIFEFGLRDFMSPPPFLLFFSRRIGFSDDGPIPIVGGARMTGRVGSQTLGFLNVVTRAEGEVPGENHSVARFKRDVGDSGYIGLMATDRRGSDGWNTTAGVDAQFRPTSKITVDAFAASTWTEGDGGDDVAYRAAFDYTADRIGVRASHYTIGDEANAELGFITRTDIRHTEGTFRFTLRPNALGIRKVDVYNNGSYASRVDGALQDWEVGPFIGTEFNTSDDFTFFYRVAETVVDEAFELADSIPVATGTYDQTRVGWWFRSSNARRVYLTQNTTWQEFYGGQRLSLDNSLTLAPSPTVSVTAGYRWDDVDLPEGDFVADVISGRVNVALSTRFNTNLTVQYNRFADTVLANLRVNFIHRPGSDLFLVYTEEWGDGGDLDLASRGLALKGTYLIRF
jgi:hypothetical protein